MSTSVPFGATAGRASTTAAPITVADTTGPAARVGAWVVLLGTVITTIGVSWDIQWHVDVGPDTFFTVPHLFLYSGSAVSGFASLAMVIMATAAQRAGRPVPRAGGTPVRVFGGALTVPLGYLVSGAGAASFLLYGLMDLQWHSIYGFDAVLDTPAHVALGLAMTTTMIGGVIVFAAHRDELWGRIGFVAALAVLVPHLPNPFVALSRLELPVDPVLGGTVLCTAMLLLIGAIVLGRPGAALIVAAATGAQQAALWWFSPWAAQAYASAIGLPLRDGLEPWPPSFPSGIPMFLGVAALVVEAAFWLVRARQGDARKILPLLGTVIGVIVAVSMPLQFILTAPLAHFATSEVVLTAVLGIPLGLLAGFLGGRFAAMLLTLAPAEEIR
ncbi:hypothetical protein [Nocardia transvalensis]|uniref:hypothetical protein n=1 Tax=Nocardia transvalensis TaxID=37333 RepID=UPI00189320C9|nr:hypothetical protein [Nocardia transvalensis]MBF6327619.1 hypothetical protein [Nocardia transvalensis]